MYIIHTSIKLYSFYLMFILKDLCKYFFTVGDYKISVFVGSFVKLALLFIVVLFFFGWGGC